MINVTRVMRRKMPRTNMQSSAPPPGTPSRRNPSPSIFCSPVSKVPLFYDIPNRDDFDIFGYDAAVYDANAFDTQKKFFQFLNIGRTIPPKPRSSTKFSLGAFFPAINEVADVIWEKCEHLFCVLAFLADELLSYR